MSRSRQKAKGRRGGEAEQFAFIPASLLTSIAGQTLPHAALKVLTILLVGRTKERNGAMCCAESYAAKFGMTSKDTLRRSLIDLQARGIIVATRRVTAFKKHPTLYAVTWWPITNRDGVPLDKPEEATFDYLKWTNITPTIGVQAEDGIKIPSPRPSGDITPTIGVERGNHHPDGDPKRPNHHPDSRGQSLYLGAGESRVHGAEPPKYRPNQASLLTAVDRAKNLLSKQPHLTDADIARACKVDIADARVAREAIAAR